VTKKEMAEREALVVALAVRYTGPMKGPDIAKPEARFGDTVQGYTFNPYNREVYPTLSQAWQHAINRDGNGAFPERCTSQYGVAVYSSRLLALQDMRRALEREYGRNLSHVDRLILEEETKGAGNVGPQ